MKQIQKITLAFFLIGLMHCSPPDIPHRYHFDNQSEHALSITLIGANIDTLIEIPFNQKRSFVIPNELQEGGSTIEAPITTYFDEIIVENDLGHRSSKDYLNGASWEFVRSDNSDYFTIVSQEEF